MKYYLAVLFFIFFTLYCKKIKKASVILYIYIKSLFRKKHVCYKKKDTITPDNSRSDKSEEINIDSDEESLPPGSPVCEKQD